MATTHSVLAADGVHHKHVPARIEPLVGASAR